MLPVGPPAMLPDILKDTNSFTDLVKWISLWYMLMGHSRLNKKLRETFQAGGRQSCEYRIDDKSR